MLACRLLSCVAGVRITSTRKIRCLFALLILVVAGSQSAAGPRGKTKRPRTVREIAAAKLNTHNLQVRSKERGASDAFVTRGKRILVVQTRGTPKTQRSFSRDTRFHKEVQEKAGLHRGRPVLARLYAMYTEGKQVKGRLVEDALGEPLDLIKASLSIEQSTKVMSLLREQLAVLHQAGYYHGDLISGSNVNVQLVDGEVKDVRMYDPAQQGSAEEGKNADQLAVDGLEAFFADPGGVQNARDKFTTDIELRYGAFFQDLD